MKKIIFLVSGGGGNLKFFDHALKIFNPLEISLHVIADRECGAVEYAKKRKISCVMVKYQRSDPVDLLNVLQLISPDLIITNWHKIIDAVTVNAYSGKMINLHYSLLPSFAGMIGAEPVKRAFEAGCKFVGPTCHWVDEGVDTGKIIAQSVFPVEDDFDATMNDMFKRGCLILFNAVHCIFNITHFDSDSDFYYQPRLVFDPSAFDEFFWLDVAQS